MAHFEHALGGFAADGKSFRQDGIERLALGDTVLEILAWRSASDSASICGSSALI
jgi:hypothetical protein